MVEMTYGGAIRQALFTAMAADDDVYVFGEDVAKFGGVFGITKGLYEKFGPKRVKNTPLSEGAIIGEAIGAALYGLKPVAEIQFSDFITTAMSPLVDVAANYHYRNNASLPLVIRMPSGGGMRIGNFHSKCLEAWFYHVPGLKIVVPSTPRDAKGMLLAAINDPDPVLFLEQKRLYYTVKEEVEEEYFEVPLGFARTVRAGSDLTLVTYGAMVGLAVEASQEASKQGISVEVIDLRTLTPLDEATLKTSLAKPHRAILLHEAVKRGGVGGDIASLLIENCFEDLAAPLLRVGAEFCPVPAAPTLEDAYLPSVEKVLMAIDRAMKY